MKPFDLPSDTPFDWLHADLCRPAEVRGCESYLSKSPDDESHVHAHPPAAAFKLTAASGSYTLKGSDTILEANYATL